MADEGLWTQCPKDSDGFRPWHWPILPNAIQLHEARVQELVQLLESTESEIPILDFFSFPATAKNRLSRSARAFLHPTKEAEEVSFLDFIVDNVAAVNVKDGKEIRTRNDVVKIAQIGARRISKWLARLVLGPQDALIDFPHIVEKLPFLIPTKHQHSVDYWNSCTQLLGGSMQEIMSDVSESSFQRSSWFDRPVFWTDQVETEENLERLLNSRDINPEDFVFCEDSSAFFPFDKCHRFFAAHSSLSDERYIRWLNSDDMDIKYGPQSRLAL